MRVLVSLATIAAFILACTGGGGGGGGDTGSMEADIAAYEELQDQLDLARTEFLDGDGECCHVAQGDRLFWVDDSQWEYGLLSWHSSTEATVHYAFSIGEAWDNWRADDQVVAFAVEDGGDVLYPLYAIDAEDDQVGVLTVSAPTDEQKWFAYAPWDGDLFLAETWPDPRITRWSAGDDDDDRPVAYDLSGLGIGEFWAFGLDRTHLIFTESGRIWVLDRTSGEATWMRNETEVIESVTMVEDGVGFATHDGMFFWSYATSSARKLSDEIAASDYALSDTFSSAHLPYGGQFTLWGDLAIYIANSGVFTYNMVTGEVAPVLLEPRDLPRIVYRNPQVLDDGSLFVTGLTSDSGAVGADGPIYRVDL